MTERATAELLQRLFPGQPRRHIHWTHTAPDGRKQVREFESGATVTDYARHLHPETAAGPEALGVMPGIKVGGKWITPWAMLDFDSYGEGADEAFRAALDRNGLNYALTNGSTGRGIHIWFLLDGLVNLRDADRTLRFLEQVAREVGVTGLDRRPENGTLRGSGILLPYRGSGLDGRGENPLSLPTGEVVPLQDADGIPRTSAAVFVAVGRRRSPQKFIEGRTVRARPSLQPRLPSFLRDTTASHRWPAELTRLAEYWTEGRRHSLTLAAAAYGLSLRIPPEQIKEDLLNLAHAAGDPEIERRRAAIERTLERAAEDKAVAFHRFYEEAGIDSPPLTASPIVREKVAALLGKLMDEAWPGKRGKTDRSLLKTMLRLAWTHGRSHPEGIELSVSWSQLLEEADIGSSETLSKSLGRLEATQHLRRGAVSQSGNSGSFILLVTERSTPTAPPQGIEEYFGLTRTLRYGRRRLGKRPEHLLDLLLWNGPQPVQVLAERLETRVVDLRKPLAALEESGLIIFDVGDGSFHLAEDIDVVLHDCEQRDGSELARTKQKAFHRDKRERYRALLKKRGPQSR